MANEPAGQEPENTDAQAPDETTETQAPAETTEAQAPETTETQAPAETEGLTPAQLVTRVLIKTGAAQAGAETLVGKMEDGEVAALAAAVDEESATISDSEAWQEAYRAVNERIYDNKASVDGEEEGNDGGGE